MEVSDQSRAYMAVTESASADEVRFRVLEPLAPPPRAPEFEAALAIVRFRRFEWAVEKVTELGVRRVLPVIAARSDSRLVESATSRLPRWRRIAFEAAQQSRRLASPRIERPRHFERAIASGTVARRVLLDPSGSPLARLGGAGPCRFLIGPEGGWTEEEVASAKASGCIAARLGGTILRSETAAVAAASVCVSMHSRHAGETVR